MECHEEKQWRDIRYLTCLTSHWGLWFQPLLVCLVPESAPSTGRAVPTLGLLPQPGGLWEPTSCGRMCNPVCRVRSQIPLWPLPHSVTSHWWGHIWDGFSSSSPHTSLPSLPIPRALSIAQPAGKSPLSQLCFREAQGQGSPEAPDAESALCGGKMASLDHSLVLY